MANLFSIISVTVIFVIIMIVFSFEKMDYVTISIFGALICTFILSFTAEPSQNITFESFVGMVEFKPLIYMFGMQIIVAVADKNKIFQYVAINAVQVTKGNVRLLFYVICTISTVVASIIADVTVAIIFAPLIIRICRILEIEAAPYLYGMTICINIGSMITPFSSSENIIISGHFQNYSVDARWFAVNLMLLGVFLLFITLYLLDRFMLKKNKTVDKERFALIKEILVPKVVIENKRDFYLNSIFMIAIFVSFFISPEAYLVAIIGTLLMILLNKDKLSNYFKDVEWKILFFILSLYIIIGVMIENGTIEILNNFINFILPDNVMIISLFILIFSSLFSGFLANSPSALIFIAITDGLIAVNPTIAANPNALIIALLIGINVGGNFLPQGAACDIMTLSIATKFKVKGFTYKNLTKNGAIFASLHLVIGIIYVIFYSLIVY